MPNFTDDFLMVVFSELEARIGVPDLTNVDSGSTFSIVFTYIAGVRPAATGIEVAFFNSAADRTADQNEVSIEDFSLSVPAGFGATAVTRTGSISGRAPTITAVTKNLYGKATILQAALGS